MTLHHVTCHVTAVSHASSSSKRKIKEKKNKIVNVQVSHNSLSLNIRSFILNITLSPLSTPLLLSFLYLPVVSFPLVSFLMLLLLSPVSSLFFMQILLPFIFFPFF